MLTLKIIHVVKFEDSEEESVGLRILAKINSLHTKFDKMANELETLQAEVAENKTVTQSAVTLLQGLKAKLDAAGTDPAKLKALSDELDTNTNALAAAVTANTPAETETPEEPGEEEPAEEEPIPDEETPNP